MHSNLKPANFVLVRGQLKLNDFGIANAIANDATNIQRDHQVCFRAIHSVVVALCSDRRLFSTNRSVPSTTCLQKLSSFQMACGASKSADQAMYGGLAVCSTKWSTVIRHSSTSRFTRNWRRSQTPHIQSSFLNMPRPQCAPGAREAVEEARPPKAARANMRHRM